MSEESSRGSRFSGERPRTEEEFYRILERRFEDLGTSIQAAVPYPEETKGERFSMEGLSWVRPPQPRKKEESEMRREELQAHLERNEAEVKRMTEGVVSKLDNTLSEMKSENKAFTAEVRGELKSMNTAIGGVKDQIGNLRWFIGIIFTLAIIVVGLLNYFA